jgi:EAL domain-containing protein (putative c-di-GMP-specific phosphodiesterase class I)
MERLGLRLSLDDFGTGYCSLSYLRVFSLHTLKIDRLFVDNIEQSLTDQAIARAIISLAHTMGISVIAEGVESVGQMAQLRAIGCDCIQGFLISAPLPRLEFEKFAKEYVDSGPRQHAAPERLNS